MAPMVWSDSMGVSNSRPRHPVQGTLADWIGFSVRDHWKCSASKPLFVIRVPGQSLSSSPFSPSTSSSLSDPFLFATHTTLFATDGANTRVQAVARSVGPNTVACFRCS
jgi:hypothetical protein